MVAGQATDDLCHPWPVVATFLDEQAVVHDLNGVAVAHLDLASTFNLGNAIRIPAGHGHEHATSGPFVETIDVGGHKSLIRRHDPITEVPRGIRRDGRMHLDPLYRDYSTKRQPAIG